MSVTVLNGDCRETLRTLAIESVQCCVTSPPYFGLRDYGHAGQIGMEATPEAFVAELVTVFREVRRVLRNDGTLWLNLGDSYARAGGDQVAQTKWNIEGASNGQKSNRHLLQVSSDGVVGRSDRLGTRGAGAGLKAKDLIGIPWMVAFALRADGWYLRQDIIWAKPNPMPESVTDRCTKSHEYIFLLSKSASYFYDAAAIQEPSSNAGSRITIGAKSFSRGQATGAGVAASGNGLADHYDVPEFRNKRSVWTVTTKPFKGAHFATFPTDLITPCILAGTKPGDTVLDPFGGSGTTAQVAMELGRTAILCEINDAYAALISERTNITPGLALA